MISSVNVMLNNPNDQVILIPVMASQVQWYDIAAKPRKSSMCLWTQLSAWHVWYLIMKSHITTQFCHHRNHLARSKHFSKNVLMWLA